MNKPAVHLICNAHLDPVWQWRWEEGAAEAIATFRTAARLLHQHPDFIFCHNEAVLYQWVERHDPALFMEIERLVASGRWAVAGGWFIQPDTNLLGTESLLRHMLEGRRWFKKAFGVEPRVAYNFDSFGHSGGLPQLLRQAGYEMYIHMRPQPHELALPADLYRWRGVDGSEVIGYRMEVGLYHSERDNIEEKITAGIDLSLRLRRDVPVFWGLGDHGGGATREDLKRIDDMIAAGPSVPVVHSTPDRFYEAVAGAARSAPVVRGDLQRCFTGCYTSLSRLKRRAVESLGTLVQSEAAATAAWWLRGDPVPMADLHEAWRAHIFNDFHDIITGSCVEPAERDALDLYGKAADIARRTRLGAAAAFGRGEGEGPALPVTVLNANPVLSRAPVEFETMADYRPFWKGTWHLRLFRHDGREIPCQEEQPEALLPFNDWRRRISFMDDLPGVGAAHYFLKAFPGKDPAASGKPKKPALPHRFDARTALIRSVRAGTAGEVLAGPLFEPLVIADEADSWGTETSSYRRIAGSFRRVDGPRVLKAGPVRTITQSAFEFGRSRIVMDVCAYPAWPVLEFRLRITWNEARRRLKLRIPTRLAAAGVLVEIPGGAIRRPADGEEQVHGRWLLIEGKVRGRAAALGIVNSGQHGFDFKDGELRLSVLRSSAYCHERGFKIERAPARKFADIGVHEVRLLVAAGTPGDVRRMLPSLADHLAQPPFALAHLPYAPEAAIAASELLSLKPANIRLLACKPSWDEEALVLRFQEAAGFKSKAVATFGTAPYRVELDFRPFEVKTLRVERNGVWRECGPVPEK